MYADTVTGFIGQVLEECEIDEKARELLTELYNEAYQELTAGPSPIIDTKLIAVYDFTEQITLKCKLNTQLKCVFDFTIPDEVDKFNYFQGFYINIEGTLYPVIPKSEAKNTDYWYDN